MTEKKTEALERLNRGIEDSRAEVQRRTMSLAQDYFGDSAETLKQQIGENRAALEGLPDQIPGGREEAFQMMFQELMDNYTAMEQCIGEAQTRVADLDTDNIRRQGEVDATDAARRDAKELGVDLTEIEGTGSEGRITVDDVKQHAEKYGAAGEIADQAKDTAEGAAQQAQDAGVQATDQAEQVAGQAQDAAGQVAGQAQDAAGQATQQAQDAAGQATDQVGQVAGQATDAVGGLTGGGENGQGGGPLGGVTDQVGQVAGQAQDAAGQATDQASQVAGQATDQAGKSGGVPEQEIVASDAARREAKEKGIDLATIKGTGADGRIVYWDVADLPSQKEEDLAGQIGDQARQAAQGASDAAGQAASGVAGQATSATSQAVDQAGQSANSVADQVGDAAPGDGDEPKITKAARRKAEDMGRDISQIRGSGAGGLITISDVVRG